MLEILMCVWRRMKFEAELVMMRNDEGKFKWLEFKAREMLNRACYVEE